MDLPNWPDYVPTYKHYSLTSVRAAKTEPTNFPFAKMELALLPDEKLENVLDMFHYGSRVPALTITVFITILEQNR
jgi:hypothetical protein